MVKIYALGSNGSGQLAIGHKEDVSVPKDVLFDCLETKESWNSPQIKAGGNHTLLLLEGQLYVCGDFSSGACGINLDATKKSFCFKKALLNNGDPSETVDTGIALAAATWQASLIVKYDGAGLASRLYSFGTGDKGELGQGEWIFRSPKAQLVKGFPPEGTKIIDLAASVTHAVAVLSNGDVYGWGAGRKGQLGKPDAVVCCPRKITGIDFRVLRAVCGREFTYLLGSPDQGQHCVIGADKWEVKTSAPSSVKNWKDVGASWGSIFILFDNGELLSWGRDDHGQLAPQQLPPLSRIFVGSEHVVGLTKLGDVLAWGWGEHGNCGPGSTNGDVKGRWNIIASSKHLPPGGKIVSGGAGCATSWIVVLP